MAEFPAIPFWTDAYLGDTTHLTTVEHGAYILLLISAWRRPDTRIPDDDKLLARITRCTPKQWARIAPTIKDFFRIENGHLVQGRLTDEAAAVRQRRESAVANGRASALKRQGRHPTKRDASDQRSDQRNGNESPTTLTLTLKPPLPPLGLEGDAPEPTDDPPEPTDPPPAPPKPGEPRPQKCLMPRDWRPQKFSKADGICGAIVKGWDAEEHAFQVERFKAHHQATASMWADWQAVWRTWVLNSKKFADRDRSAPGGKPAPASFADQVLEEVEQRKRAEAMR